MGLSERCLRECVGCVLPSQERPRLLSFIVEGRYGGGTCVCYVVLFFAEAACPNPVACHCGGMVGGAVLCSVHWSDAPVTPVPVVAGMPSSVEGELVTVGLTGAECRGWVDAMAQAH